MTGLGDKERAEETKYALDQETEFKIVARRNKLLGLWVAELLGYEGDKSAAYAKEVVLSDFEEPGDDDVFKKVSKDLRAASVAMGDAEIQGKMAELLVIARKQIVENA